jgi:hypothetical protein
MVSRSSRWQVPQLDLIPRISTTAADHTSDETYESFEGLESEQQPAADIRGLPQGCTWAKIIISNFALGIMNDHRQEMDPQRHGRLGLT